jgi:nicotinamide mononucleotide adenylyltransferase
VLEKELVVKLLTKIEHLIIIIVIANDLKNNKFQFTAGVGDGVGAPVGQA